MDRAAPRAVVRPPVRVSHALFALALVGGVALAACGSGGSPKRAEPPAPTGAAADDKQLRQGRTLYGKFCAECHGVRGEGGVGPNIQQGKTSRDFATLQQQIDYIERGANTMPGFQGTLTPSQLEAVARYRREVL